jgi:hypothetical protein
MVAAREGRGKSELRRAGCRVKAREGPVAGPDSPDWRPQGREQQRLCPLRANVKGVKRAILPAAISETTAARPRVRERWLAEPVEGESSYRGDKVAGPERG